MTCRIYPSVSWVDVYKRQGDRQSERYAHGCGDDYAHPEGLEHRRALDELSLIHILVEEVSDIAYDKAVEVVTDTVRQETHKEDLRLVEETKNWVLSPERKAPQKEREYAAARLDGVI